jgi:hypothetical protein
MPFSFGRENVPDMLNSTSELSSRPFSEYQELESFAPHMDTRFCSEPFFASPKNK